MTKRANRFIKFDIAELQHLLAGLLSSPMEKRKQQPTQDLIAEVSEMLDQRIAEEESET
jgi:hypothetical protein